MLIALVTLLFLGGGDSGLDVFDKEHRKIVVEVVQDEDRAAKVVAEMKATEKVLDKDFKEIMKLVKAWKKLDKNASSGRMELESAFVEGNAIRVRAFETYTDTIFALREQTSEQEWTAFTSSRDDGE